MVVRSRIKEHTKTKELIQRTTSFHSLSWRTLSCVCYCLAFAPQDSSLDWPPALPLLYCLSLSSVWFLVSLFWVIVVSWVPRKCLVAYLLLCLRHVLKRTTRPIQLEYNHEGDDYQWKSDHCRPCWIYWPYFKNTGSPYIFSKGYVTFYYIIEDSLHVNSYWLN